MSVGQTPPSSMGALAQRLLSLERRMDGGTDQVPGEVIAVFVGLRMALARFAGSDGFASLVRRALALASADHPALRQVSVRADGSLEGLEQVAREATVAIVAQYLGLLVTFIGEPLTLHLIRDVWPDESLMAEENNGKNTSQSHEQ